MNKRHTRQKINADHIKSPAGESRDSRGRFLSGNTGGPGRPPGSRNALGEAFVAAVYEDWTKHGMAALAAVRINCPGSYVRVIASLVPRDVLVQPTTSKYDHLTNQELVETLHEQTRLLLLASESEED